MVYFKFERSKAVVLDPNKNAQIVITKREKL